MQKYYAAIDLKSFYASVECRDRGLDPLTTNLVVADIGRTEKTICLAVSPSLKAYGIPGRVRLFEVVQKIAEVNALRKVSAPGRRFKGTCTDDKRLQKDKGLSVDYIVAAPRMAHYIDISTQIYRCYLNWVAPEDIHVYSIDEVFIDLTHYLGSYNCTAKELTRRLIQSVYEYSGITATAGIGSNLYLSKIAMDIMAKHAEQDADGVRIAQLDERSYREQLWGHEPITDFWRVGEGIARRLEKLGLRTMGDVARCSLGQAAEFYNEELLYKTFGINAELLIDHAWGVEPCSMSDIKAYRPRRNSISVGQVLPEPYSFKKAELVVREMADSLSLDLVRKGLKTDRMVLTVGYDVESLKDPVAAERYHGKYSTDRYGRELPKQAHGSIGLGTCTSSTCEIVNAISTLFKRIVHRDLLVRRMYVVAEHVLPEHAVEQLNKQISLFEIQSQASIFTEVSKSGTSSDTKKRQSRRRQALSMQQELRLQKALLKIRQTYGDNAVLRGMNLVDGATARKRNKQIGGHRA